MKYIFIILLLSGSSCAIGQNTNIDTAKINDTTHLSVQFLTGFWVSTDSSQNKIEFKTGLAGFMLIIKNVAWYSFFNDGIAIWPDSIIGVQIRWPPYGCYVKKISKDQIEVGYENFDFGIYAHKFRYIRAEAIKEKE